MKKARCSFLIPEHYLKHSDYVEAPINSYRGFRKTVRGVQLSGAGHFYSIWMKPHPAFPLSDAIAIAGEPKFSYHHANKETLEECIAWADAALYVHSTAAIEFLSRGVPVIYVNIDNIINPEPLSTFTDFRWQADSPRDLVRIITEIDSLSDEEFYDRQKKAVRYIEEYSYPVNESSMDVFLKV